jgi:hypothetical protein
MYKYSARPVAMPVASTFADAGSRRNTIWRFFTDASHHWKWQRLSVQGEIISQSNTSYNDFEECLSDASVSGYVFQPSQPRRKSTAASALSS